MRETERMMKRDRGRGGGRHLGTRIDKNMYPRAVVDENMIQDLVHMSGVNHNIIQLYAIPGVRSGGSCAPGMAYS